MALLTLSWACLEPSPEFHPPEFSDGVQLRFCWSTYSRSDVWFRNAASSCIQSRLDFLRPWVLDFENLIAFRKMFKSNLPTKKTFFPEETITLKTAENHLAHIEIYREPPFAKIHQGDRRARKPERWDLHHIPGEVHQAGRYKEPCHINVLKTH